MPDQYKSDDWESNILGAGNHTHSGTTSATGSTTTSAVGVTYAAFSNDPPYHKVIFIKANGYQAIPNNCVLFYNDTTIPSNFARHSAADNRYYKGAATGADGSGTGGSTTNTHTITHTHTDTHTHTGTSGGSR